MATDNFNRADGGLGANWTTLSGRSAPTIVSNKLTAPDAGIAIAWWNADAFANDQESSAVFIDVDASGLNYLAVRCASNNAYVLEKSWGTGNCKIYSYLAGSFALIHDFGVNGTTGQVFLLRAVGTSLSLRINGSQIGSDLTGQTDLTSGSAGAGAASTSTAVALDDWIGADVGGGGSPQIPFLRL